MRRKYPLRLILDLCDFLHLTEEEKEDLDNIITDIEGSSTETNKVEPPKEKSVLSKDLSPQKTITPPTKEEGSNKLNKVEPPTKSPSSNEIKDMIKKEVSSELKSQSQKKTSLENNIKKSQSSTPTKSLLKPSKGGSHKSKTPKKKPMSNPLNYSHNKRLEPLNISKDRWGNMVNFQSNEVVSLLNRLPQSSVIFSVCLGDRTTFGNKDLTDLFVKDLITTDYSYVPIYLFDGKTIRNIIFIVLNLPQRTKQPNRTFKDLVEFISLKSSSYKIGMFYTYEGGKFYQYQNGSKLLTTDRDYKTLLMMLSNNNRIVVKDSYFILNPKPLSKNEIYNRTKVNNEICIN